MAHAEDVVDLGALVGTPPEAAEVNPVPPLDAGEGSSAAPVPTVADEDPVSAPAPTTEDALKVVAEPAAEDPRPRSGLRRWLNRCWGVCKFCLCVTEPRLLRRFRVLGLRMQPLLTMLILCRLRPWLLKAILMILCLSFLSLMILEVRLCGRRGLRKRTWIISQRWMWLRRRLLRV
jgi:hypothetical protein